jgi:AraC family transcriptional regulator
MSEPMDLAAIAAEVDIHPVHMARVFRRHFGCSPGTYLRRLRVRQACRLLTETDRPLAHVALDLGYADQSHFTRTFKRSLGVPPGEYRRLTRT